jgi:hypothetical protein
MPLCVCTCKKRADYGNREHSETKSITLTHTGSAIGYNEIMTGYADTLINSNHYLKILM